MEAAVNHLKKDKKLKAVLEKVELPVIVVRADIYPELLNAIVSQQLSVKAAASIFAKFKAMYDGDVPQPEELLETSNEDLRAVGLSRAKAQYVKNIAEKFIEQNWLYRNWQEVDNEEIIKELTEIKGVGEWTVQMILMFALNRPDVFPVKDLGIRNAMVSVYGLKETGKPLIEKLYKIAAKWQPYRSVACYALWEYWDKPSS